MILPIVLGALLAIVHYFSDRFHLLRYIQKMKFVSFTGGIFISYIILHMLPNIFVGNIFLSRVSLIFVLAGFSIFHLVEKYIYVHEKKSKDELKRELMEIHSITFFIYHFVLGLVLVSIFSQLSDVAGMLFFVPLVLITMVSSISLKEIHGRLRQKKPAKIFLSISSLLGVFVASFFPLTTMIYSILLGFVIGALLFVTITDSIPRERKGEPVFFVLGVALYALLIGVTWVI